MPVTTNGKEWKEYYDEDWPEEAYHENETFYVNGKEVDTIGDEGSIKDTDIVTLVGGVIILQECDPENRQVVEVDFEKHFRQWKKNLGRESYVVSIPKGCLKGLKAALKPIKGKVTT